MRINDECRLDTSRKRILELLMRLGIDMLAVNIETKTLNYVTFEVSDGDSKVNLSGLEEAGNPRFTSMDLKDYNKEYQTIFLSKPSTVPRVGKVRSFNKGFIVMSNGHIRSNDNHICLQRGRSCWFTGRNLQFFLQNGF
jgi:hypothetical protein